MTTGSPHYRACNLCEAICGIEIKVEPGPQLSIRGDKDDPFSHGYICPKAVALQDIHYDKDRLKYPVRRLPDGGWRRMDWDEAFAEVAKNLKGINAKYGRNSIGTYIGNPTVHNYGAILFAPGFLRSLRTRNRFSATSVDQLAHHVASFLMFGHQLLLPIPDVDRTKFFLVLGANPAVSNGSMMTAPGLGRRLQEIQRNGGKVILIDPRQNETARLVDQHLFIRPGTDVLLLLALLQVIFEEGLTRPGPLASFTKGFEQIEALVKEFPPERIASITGIDSDQIRTLAREFAAAKSAVCYGRIGVSTQEFGAVCQWLINVLNIVTGNFDRPGGAMFTLPAFDPLSAPESIAPRGSFGRWHSRVRKLPEFAGELPVAALAEEILTPGEGQVKALVTLAGNPVLSTPNGRELDQALASLEFMVSIDIYINETTRHAHIILPPTSSLERGHYDVAFNLLAVRNTAKFSPPLFDPAPDSRADWQILAELQTRMEHKQVGRVLRGVQQKFTRKFFGPERILDLGLRFGPYGARLNPFSKGLTLRKVRKAVHGIDLGPLTPCLEKRLCTADKRIDLAPEILVKDLERVKAKFFDNAPADLNGNLLLIGRRHLRSNNSWMHNTRRLLRDDETQPRCTILMNPVDAGRRNLSSGQSVKVESRVGSIVIPIEVSEEMMPGVVSIPHGWGHDRPGNKMEVAQQHPGQSINDLTDNQAIDALCGTAAFNGTVVTVSAVQ
ncbi:MAG TPA: molybdopterin-dependent oxidoreductase [Pyrinomonadaceae bacterium]|nr:molybdopterin-dependent oxidoreductase [Pyrinomonadaceae bacterium]